MWSEPPPWLNGWLSTQDMTRNGYVKLVGYRELACETPMWTGPKTVLMQETQMELHLRAGRCPRGVFHNTRNGKGCTHLIRVACAPWVACARRPPTAGHLRAAVSNTVERGIISLRSCGRRVALPKVVNF